MPAVEKDSKDHLSEFCKRLCYMRYFFVVYAAFVLRLQLNSEEEKFFNEVIFPLSYLRIIWRRLSRKAKEENREIWQNLEAKIRDAPWSEELKEEWLKKGREMAEVFQRSSSCVEGSALIELSSIPSIK